MAWTKRQLIVQAFEELALADYVFNIGPEPLESALRRLDAMMGEWNAKGIRLGYPIPTDPGDSELDDSSGVPDSANEAIILNLAMRIAPSFGKVVATETRQIAKAALNTLWTLNAIPRELQSRRETPAGEGSWQNRSGYRRGPFLPAPDDPILAGQDSQINLE